MSRYTTDDLLADVARSAFRNEPKAQPIHTPSGEVVPLPPPQQRINKTEKAREAWDAVKGWIALQFDEKSEGAKIPTFCRFSWVAADAQHLGTGSSRQGARPLFALSERFISKNGLRFRKPTEGSEPRCEDINFSRIAIKFSRSLTKDHVFSFCKELISRVGIAMSQGRDVDIDFGIGRLVAHECTVTFIFDGTYMPFGDQQSCASTAITSVRQRAPLPRHKDSTEFGSKLSARPRKSYSESLKQIVETQRLALHSTDNVQSARAQPPPASARAFERSERVPSLPITYHLEPSSHVGTRDTEEALRARARTLGGAGAAVHGPARSERRENEDCHSTVGTEFMFPPRDIAKLVMENPDPRAVLIRNECLSPGAKRRIERWLHMPEIVSKLQKEKLERVVPVLRAPDSRREGDGTSVASIAASMQRRLRL